jgi:hypothetical protein
MTDDLAKRRAEAIKAYNDRAAKAAQDAEKEAERVRQRQAKWVKTSQAIMAGVMRASDKFAREGSPFIFKHHQFPTKLRRNPHQEFYQYFEIRPIRSEQDQPPYGHLDFSMNRLDDAVIIDTHLGEEETVALDDLTEDLAEQIASEAMIALLSHED